MFFLLLSVRTIIEFSFILWSGAFIYFPSLDKEFAREQKEGTVLWLLSSCSLAALWLLSGCSDNAHWEGRGQQTV